MLARSELLADNGSSSAATRLAGFRGSSVEGWEQERFGLDGSARVLFSVIAHEPEAVVRSLRKSDRRLIDSPTLMMPSTSASRGGRAASEWKTRSGDQAWKMIFSSRASIGASTRP